MFEGVDLGPFGCQKLLVGGNELQVGGGGGVVMALQLREEVLGKIAHRGVEEHAHALH